VSDLRALGILACERMSMWPTRITPRRELNSVWLTEARNDHELPHVLERAVVLATGPML
jgi:hypothetical protein